MHNADPDRQVKKKKKRLNHFRGTGGDFSLTGKCS